LGAIVAGACSGESFTSASNEGSGGAGGSSGAGSGGTSGTGGTGGKGGSSGSGGSGATGGSGGSATGGSGGSATGGTGGGLDARPDCRSSGCPAGDYCNTETLGCTACADLSRLEFTLPEKLSAVSETTEGNQRFPRLTHNPGEMLFQTGAYNAVKQLWVTSDYTATGQHQLLSGVAVTSQSSNAPLEASISIGGASANFFFDRTVAGINSNHDLYAGLRSGTSVTGVTRLPAPFNDTGSNVYSNYSVAVAPAKSRLWWMTTRSGSTAGMVTSLATGSSITVVNPVIGDNACVRRGADATPWVTSDGSLMLFRSIEQDDICVPTLDVNDIYAVPLDATSGTTVGSAQSLNVNTTGWDDTDPMMSPDLCWIFFASDGGAQEGEYDIYRAQRN
jgi:hypothetical protein